MIVQSAPTQEIEVIHLSPSYLRAKRILDITVTLLLAPALFLAIAVIALLIRLDSPGPIFFRQKRLGQNGEEFDFIKFRSMYVNNDDAAHRAAVKRFMDGERINSASDNANQYKIAADNRITRIGNILRKTSLDELPQFLNVLRGEMSLVGPRPALAYEVEYYSLHDRLRLTGKPGLTGIWQVYGRSRVPFNEMVEMDLTYLREQSLWLDLKLVILTVPVMLFARGGA